MADTSTHRGVFLRQAGLLPKARGGPLRSILGGRTPGRRSASRSKLTRQARAIESEEALAAGTLGFMARVLVQSTLPHKKPATSVFLRENGRMQLYLSAHPKLGLPYGRYPRLLLAWLTTEAVRTRSPQLQLGASLSQFMARLGILPTGGRWGTIPHFRDQMKRLFTTSIAVTFDGESSGEWHDSGFRITSESHLWWEPREPDDAAIWGSHVILGADFFRAIIERPVPIDLRVLRALRSPLAFDIYAWLTYRMSYLKKATCVSWGSLAAQFGSDYKDVRDFRRKFLHNLEQILTLYPAARVRLARGRLILEPSRPHIPKALSAP